MLASSEQRKQAALPISSGVEKRPNGMVERNLARISGVSFQQFSFLILQSLLQDQHLVVLIDVLVLGTIAHAHGGH